MPGMGTAYAVPFEPIPIPIPGEEGLNLDQLDKLTAEAPDADSLAAMWLLSRTNWDVEGVQAGEYWPQFNVLTGSFENPVELSLSMAAQIAARWEAHTAQVAQHAAYPQMQLQPGTYQTVYNSAT
ncbi:hypothetical protein EHS25_004792 [Saitozyma podzolica]|uniref:Uncharacterized protein n=1 Tax=Saitozyma podzolica TaxID=1890683 RepID=A0A427Y2M4_9TREE|nr:hypothetical protein EHS25_004792 [Saitozyma podzolica]